MSTSYDHYGVENQRTMSYAAGREFGLLEAALCMLDNPSVDLSIASTLEAIKAPEADVTEARVKEYRAQLLKQIHSVQLDFGDHFRAG